MKQTKRMLKPQVINVFDNAVVQVKCIPSEDEVDVAAILGHSLARFEFIIGTSFDLQFLTMDGSRLLAMRRYIVTEVIERIATDSIDYYRTLTKTVYDRKCAPIGDLIVFHEEGDKLRESLVDEKSNGKRLISSELGNMSTADLQSAMKNLSGRGFPIGTTQDTMVKAIRRHLSSAAKE